MPRGVKAAEPAETETPNPEAAEPAEVEETTDAAEPQETGRFETFEATRPDGVVVVVRRNIDTGEQTVTEKD